MRSSADAIQKKINKKSPNNQADAKKPTEQSQEFVDKRNQTNKSNSIADLANDGNSAMQLKAFNLLANSSSPVQQLMAIQQDPVQAKMLQLKGVEAELPIQGKYKNGTIQQKSAEGTSQNSK